MLYFLFPVPVASMSAFYSGKLAPTSHKDLVVTF